jgi:transcriptional regulator with XRE-family HTH domain
MHHIACDAFATLLWMRSRDVIRIARDQAGLTQQQLAARSGRPRETIARWESGVQIPSLEAVSALVADCDLDLVLRLTKRDTTLLERVREQLALPMSKRLRRLLPSDSLADTKRALLWLGTARTPTIVVGQLGAVLLGAPQRPETSRVEFVSADPVATDQELRGTDLTPIDADDRWRSEDIREPWKLPKGGMLALARNLPGTKDYPDLKRSASQVTVDANTTVLIAHPKDLLRMAEASPRESERARVPGLQALLEATSEQES